MAKSPSHRFGQYLGNLLEALLAPELEKFCAERHLYLDRYGARAARKGKKARWTDGFGNSHDLDFIIERGGSHKQHGRPVAFIEAAWRRYTKHSRNKAQEIQGAILPLAEHYRWDSPFMGAVLAGCFTAGSLQQLRSLGFDIVYIEYESLIRDFATLGVDIRFDENTPDDWFTALTQKIDGGGGELSRQLIERVGATNRVQIDDFLKRLKRRLVRHVAQLVVIPIFGDQRTFQSVTEAVAFVDAFKPAEASGQFRGFEILVKYSNGDAIDGRFEGAAETLRFLRYVAQ